MENEVAANVKNEKSKQVEHLKKHRTVIEMLLETKVGGKKPKRRGKPDLKTSKP